MTEKAKRKDDESPQPENKGLVTLFLMFGLLNIVLLWALPSIRLIPSGAFDWNELILRVFVIQNLFWVALLISLIGYFYLFSSYRKWIQAGILVQLGLLLCISGLLPFAYYVQFLDKISVGNLDYYLLHTNHAANYDLNITVCAENQCENYEILYCDACPISDSDNPSQLTYDAESDELIIRMSRGILRIAPQDLNTWQVQGAWGFIEP